MPDGAHSARPQPITKTSYQGHSIPKLITIRVIELFYKKSLLFKINTKKNKTFVGTVVFQTIIIKNSAVSN